MPTMFPFDNTYSKLPERFFAKLNPTPVKSPSMIQLNEELAKILGADVEQLKSKDGVGTLSGNHVPVGAEPLAMAYAGQQFGNWVPQLGDGRALLLGEVVDAEGLRFDIQLKGSGPTPFSRGGDGRAWLGPIIREYVVSEAMAAMNIPSTRALAMCTTGEDIYRETVLPGAILTRVSRCLVRVGTFQYFAMKQDIDAAKVLADYTITRLYPEIEDAENPYLELLKKVVLAQTSLVAKWMNVGFIHGVMNTDNVSIAGETVDYGPCAFMDDYHPNRVFSSIDEQGRYAFSNQPRIAHWNMVQFAQTLLPLLGETTEKAVENAQETVNSIPDNYMHAYQSGMNQKLGLSKIREGDTDLGKELLEIMQQQKSDFTLTFRALAHGEDRLIEEFLEPSVIEPWIEKWKQRLAQEKSTKQKQTKQMLAVNPAFIPRNHRIQQAIDAALEDDIKPLEQLLKVLKTPFVENPKLAFLMESPEPEEVVPYTTCGT